MTILDDLKRLKCMAVAFTGGEATTHQDLVPLVQHARKNGLSVSLKTNAMTLDTMTDDFKEAGVQYIEVSLHGATAATHDRVTRVSGSFDKCISGIKAAKAANIPVTLKSCLFSWNVNEAPAIQALAKSLGCLITRDFFMVNTDFGRSFDNDIIRPDQIRHLESFWPGSSVKENQNQQARPKVCTQGISTIAVTADGEILSCIQVRRPLGTVKEISLIEAWNRSVGRAHDINYDKFSRCTTCELLPQCSVCIGQNETATGSFYEPPIERCYITMTLYGKERIDKNSISSAEPQAILMEKADAQV